MADGIKERILNTIQKFNLINKNDKLVIGVSGGPDSICLLHILVELKEILGFSICVAHINHMIREEADSETKYVQQFCDNLGVECFVKKIDVMKKANLEKIGTEETGRKVRYEFFEEVLKKTLSNKIVTAHNANDNAETVLMNIFRGTGTSGLKGIEPIRDNKFIRPLIECNRSEIEAYCSDNNLEPKIDKSNFENIYTRNKIRNILIPQIQKEFNPNIIENLNKLSDIAKQENDFLQNLSESILYKDLIISQNNESLVLDLKKFNELDVVLKNRIVLIAIKKVLGNVQGIEKIHIEDIVKLCDNNIGNKFLSPNKNIKVFVGKGEVCFNKVG